MNESNFVNPILFFFPSFLYMHSFSNSFIISNSFILVRITVDPDPIHESGIPPGLDTSLSQFPSDFFPVFFIFLNYFLPMPFFLLPFCSLLSFFLLFSLLNCARSFFIVERTSLVVFLPAWALCLPLLSLGFILAIWDRRISLLSRVREEGWSLKSHLCKKQCLAANSILLHASVSQLNCSRHKDRGESYFLLTQKPEQKNLRRI